PIGGSGVTSLKGDRDAASITSCLVGAGASFAPWRPARDRSPRDRFIARPNRQDEPDRGREIPDGTVRPDDRAGPPFGDGSLPIPRRHRRGPHRHFAGAGNKTRAPAWRESIAS